MNEKELIEPQEQNSTIKNQEPGPLTQERLELFAKAWKLKGQGYTLEQVAKACGRKAKSWASNLLNDSQCIQYFQRQQQQTVLNPSNPTSFVTASIEEDAPLPNEPPELMTELELKQASKRVSSELKVKRQRARSAYYDRIAEDPGFAFRSHSSRNDGGSNQLIEMYKLQLDNSREQQRITREDMRFMQQQLLANKGGEQFGFKDFIGSVMTLQGNQQKQNWDFYSNMINSLKTLQPSIGTQNPVVALELKKMEINMEKWKSEREDSDRKYSMIEKLASPLIPSLDKGITSLFGGEKVGLDNQPDSTRLACEKCAHVWTVSTEIARRKQIECPECHNPVDPSLFLPQTATFECPKCKEKLNINVKGLKGDIKVKCPKCGEITQANLEGQPQEKPTEEKPQKEERSGRLRPKFS